MNTSYDSFHYWVRENMPERSVILELGSGPGTSLLTEKFKVYSIEHDPAWIGHVEDTNYIYAPMTRYRGYRWYDVAILKEELGRIIYDAIIIDGPTGTLGRLPILRHMDLFSWSVPIIVDDVNRRAEWNLFTAIRDNEAQGTQYSEVFQGTNRRFGVLY